MKKRGKQSDIEGPGFEKPPRIKALEDAADELFETVDDMQHLKEQKERHTANVMQLMREANKTIYVYDGKTVSIEGKETIKVKSARPREGRKHKGDNTDFTE